MGSSLPWKMQERNCIWDVLFVKRLLLSHRTVEPTFRIPTLEGEPGTSPSKSLSVFYEIGSSCLLLGPANVHSSRVQFSSSWAPSSKVLPPISEFRAPSCSQSTLREKVSLGGGQSHGPEAALPHHWSSLARALGRAQHTDGTPALGGLVEP